MLLVTLPSANNLELIKKMYQEQEVGGARYNVGIRTSLAPFEALSRIKEIADANHKKLYVDLKGRQLRIIKWADPTYGDIELSHEVDVDLPARVFFRGNEYSNLVDFKGNKIFVSPDPKYALGAGQAINIIGKNLRILGKFLTDEDEEYITESRKLGIHDYMVSFFHTEKDLNEIMKIDPLANCILKIEDRIGLNYVQKTYSHEKGRLMAASDDLMINIGENKFNMISALEKIIKKDSEAIAASHLFTSLCNGELALADIGYLKFLQDMGYKNFMMSDGVSHKYFEPAIKLWKDFKEVYND
jgi:pyruvate kinase